MIDTFIDMCSGIGAGRLGLEQNGLKCVGYADTARLAPITYRLMHDTENEKNFKNVKRLKIDELPDFDLLIAGFPCQSFSVIGRKDGFDDPRGQIIFSLADIIKEKQPNSFLLENVKGLITHDDGRTLKKIISILEKAGYIVIYKVLNSIDYGVPQNRQRVYILGFNKELNKDISEFHWPERIEKPDLNDFLIDDNIVTDERIAILDHYLKNDQNKGKYSVDDLKLLEGKILDTRMNDLRIYDGKCPTLRAQRDGILYVKNNAIHQLTGYEALLLQGFPKEYADKVKDKVTDRHLLMQAGNAMTVTVIKELGKEIIRFLKEE